MLPLPTPHPPTHSPAGPQVVTLEALLQQSNTPEKDKRASDPGAAGGKGAQGLTYVMASGGRLWSTALRLESQRAEGAAERTIRWGALGFAAGQGRGLLPGGQQAAATGRGSQIGQEACICRISSCWQAWLAAVVHSADAVPAL